MPFKLKEHRFFWPIKLFLKRLFGRELRIFPDIKTNTLFLDEWEICPDFIDKNSIIFSLGVGDSVAFDMKLIETFKSTVYAFDPTPFAKEWIKKQPSSENFNFFPWAVSGEDRLLEMYQRINRKGEKSKVMWTEIRGDHDNPLVIQVESYSLDSIMKKLNVKKIDLLKMDVEGSEYEIIDTILDMNNKPSQLLVEFHHRFPNIGFEKTNNAIKNLHKIGYRIFSVSKTGRELGFIQKNLFSDL